jgi:AraC family transcriptional regulator of adaptative response / methylphosphotriester-DNA alkyltransferase methyltransferase
MSSTDNEKWDAVIHCDDAYDGKFFYGVKTTGIFCRPSCKSKPPLRENVEFFDNIEDACNNGFRPRKRCRPDLLEYKPKAELLNKVKTIYDNFFNDSSKLALEIKQLHVSQNHLIRLFKQQFGMTPIEYINKLRIEKAIQLLSYAETNTLNIAFLCGFGSLSSFYGCFKKQTGITPNEYKKTRLQR